MKVAKAIREKERQYVSLEKLKKLLAKLKIEEKGMTKSGEKILIYKGNEFTITRGNTEGFDIDKITDKIAQELTKIKQGYVPGTKPLNIAKEEAFLKAYEKLNKRLKGLKLK